MIVGSRNMAKGKKKQVVKFPRNVLLPLRNYLISKREKLEKRKTKLAKEDPFADSDRINNNAASDAEAAEQSGHVRVTALKKEVDKGLINVRKTLTKIKVGKFGLCDSCGKMIDTDRLSIDPTAEFCVKCSAKKI